MIIFDDFTDKLKVECVTLCRIYKCFAKNYEHLFDIPYNARIDNDVSGLSPIYISQLLIV